MRLNGVCDSVPCLEGLLSFSFSRLLVISSSSFVRCPLNFRSFRSVSCLSCILNDPFRSVLWKTKWTFCRVGNRSYWKISTFGLGLGEKFTLNYFHRCN